MGRGRRAAQGRADRAGGRAVRDHDRGQPDRDRDRAALDEAEPWHMTSSFDAIKHSGRIARPGESSGDSHDDAPAVDAPSYAGGTGVRAPRDFDLRARRSWRSVKNQLMIGLMIAAVALVAIPLVAV